MSAHHKRYAYREHDQEDRRVVRAFLTEKGAAVLAEIDAPLLKLHRAQFGHLAADELEALIALLKKARGDEA